jgi:hypothetical protein
MQVSVLCEITVSRRDRFDFDYTSAFDTCRKTEKPI